MNDRKTEGLPVHGYQPQNDAAIGRVNAMKIQEEGLLRILDQLQQFPEIDGRWLAIGRTHLEQAFMAINRSIFKPKRFEPHHARAEGAAAAE
jgi:hypothetical protein